MRDERLDAECRVSLIWLAKVVKSQDKLLASRVSAGWKETASKLLPLLHRQVIQRK